MDPQGKRLSPNDPGSYSLPGELRPLFVIKYCQQSFILVIVFKLNS